MENIEQTNAYSEVLGILNYLNMEDYKKIPKDVINTMKENSNKEYKFEYDPTKKIDEQNISEKAKILIGIIYRDYLASEEEREKILESQKKNKELLDKNKKNETDLNDLFSSRTENFAKIEKQEKSMVEIEKEENFFKKILNKIKGIFAKK